METKHTIIPLLGHVFEDTIDGYFPLRESLRQMMERQDFSAAIVSITFAPAMEIPELAPQDPVPLYLTDGFGCMINRMSIIVRFIGGEIAIEGVGDWTWFDGPLVGSPHFSPLHRLAEPAFVRGVGFKTGDLATTVFGQIEEGDLSANFALLQLDENQAVKCAEVLKSLGWFKSRLLFTRIEHNLIVHDEARTEALSLSISDGMLTNYGSPIEVIIAGGEGLFEADHSFLNMQHWPSFK